MVNGLSFYFSVLSRLSSGGGSQCNNSQVEGEDRVFVEDQVIYLHIGEFSSVIYTCMLPPHSHIMALFFGINKHYTFCEEKKYEE